MGGFFNPTQALSSHRPYRGRVSCSLFEHFGFSLFFDDYDNIIDNPLVRDSGYFLEPSKAGLLQLKKNVHISWATRYLGYLSFHLNYLTGGMDPPGYRAANIVIHIANSLLVYLLVLLLFKTPVQMQADIRKHSRPAALAVALLFAAHPVQT